MYNKQLLIMIKITNLYKIKTKIKACNQIKIQFIWLINSNKNKQNNKFKFLKLLINYQECPQFRDQKKKKVSDKLIFILKYYLNINKYIYQ